MRPDSTTLKTASLMCAMTVLASAGFACSRASSAAFPEKEQYSEERASEFSARGQSGAAADEYVRIGELLVGAQSPSESARLFGLALKLEPNHPAANFYVGLMQASFAHRHPKRLGKILREASKRLEKARSAGLPDLHLNFDRVGLAPTGGGAGFDSQCLRRVSGWVCHVFMKKDPVYSGLSPASLRLKAEEVDALKSEFGAFSERFEQFRKAPTQVVKTRVRGRMKSMLVARPEPELNLGKFARIFGNT